VDDRVIGLVAAVKGTGHPVVSVGRRAVDTTLGGIARFRAVAKQAVVTSCIAGRMHHYVIGLITAVNCAVNAVINFRCRPRETALLGVTVLLAVAVDSVVTVDHGARSTLPIAAGIVLGTQASIITGLIVGAVDGAVHIRTTVIGTGVLVVNVQLSTRTDLLTSVD
jgi:hypothetical protein